MVRPIDKKKTEQTFVSFNYDMIFMKRVGILGGVMMTMMTTTTTMPRPRGRGEKVDKSEAFARPLVVILQKR